MGLRIMKPLWERLSPNPLRELNKRRERLPSRYPDLPPHVRALFSTPLPEQEARLSTLDLVGVDFETTGFDPEQDELLSVGYVNLSNNKIALASAVSHYIMGDVVLKRESAAINQIDRETLMQGLPLDDVMTSLIGTLTDRIPVAHGTFMEQGFLAYYLKHRYGLDDCPLLWIDTLRLYKSTQLNSVRGDVRLASARAALGLPEYLAHNALFDAVSCSELLLVLVKKIYRAKSPTLRQLFTRQ